MIQTEPVMTRKTIRTVDCRDDSVRVVVQEWNYLIRCGVGNARESTQIAEPNSGVDALGNPAYDPSAEDALTSVTAQVGFHQRSGHPRERYRFDGQRKGRCNTLEGGDVAIGESTGRPCCP